MRRSLARLGDRSSANFDRGDAARVRELHGNYPGRCYFFDSPTKPVASVLVVRSGETQRLGPAFAADDYKKVVPFIAKDAAPYAFDTLDIAARAEIDRAFSREQDANAYPVSSNQSLVIEGLRTVAYQLRSYALRKVKSFLVLRLTCEEDTYCLNSIDGQITNRVLANSGESNAVCYYWSPRLEKKVRKE